MGKKQLSVFSFRGGKVNACSSFQGKRFFIGLILLPPSGENIETVIFLKFQTLFLFSNRMLVIRARIHQMLVLIANRGDPDQTASSEAV